MISTQPWTIKDDGLRSAEDHMAVDRQALESFTEKSHPLLRFFQWSELSVTYGYLLDEAAVRNWASDFGNVPLVKRPTGGGAVLHHPSDLAISILWPRGSGFLPDRPQKAYEVIHRLVLNALTRSLPKKDFSLAQNCQSISERQHFSICFSEPVCNDILLEGKKMVGGAMRLSRQAVLYQGNIQTNDFLDGRFIVENVKSNFLEGVRYAEKNDEKPGCNFASHRRVFSNQH